MKVLRFFPPAALIGALVLLAVGVLALRESASVSRAADGDPSVVATVGVGHFPKGVAVNPVTNRIYVTNYGSGNVSVIDGASNTVIATVAVGTWPGGVAVNANTNRIYVANYYNDNVSVIDGASNTVIATIAVGLGPEDVAVNANTNRIYVANWVSDNVSVIDGASNTVIATVAAISTAYRVAVNPVTNRIYVSTWSALSVSVIDGASNTVVANVVVGSVPGGVAVNTDANRIYVATWTLKYVSVIDGASNTVTDTIAVGSYPYGVGVIPNANRIYVTKPDSDNVSVIDGTSNTVIATVAVGTWPYGVALNTNTNRIYVANYEDDTVSVIEDTPTPTTPTPTTTTPTATPPPAVEIRGDWRFDEGSGTTADDSSSYGNDGEVRSASWVSGVAGQALDFSGTDDSYVEVPNAPELTPTTRLVIDAWVKPESYPTWHTAIVYKGDLQQTGCFGERSYSLWAMDNGGIVFSSTSEGESCQRCYYTPSGLIRTGEWSHVRVDLDTDVGRVQIFVNDALVLEQSHPQKPIKVGNSPLRIGGMFRSLGDQSDFSGSIDEVKIYGEPPPTPPSVGGIVELHVGSADSSPVDGSGSDGPPYAALAGGLISAALLTLTAGAWYAKRRWM